VLHVSSVGVVVGAVAKLHEGPALQVLFSRPLPDFSCRLNAAATALTCQWLMGPCRVNDVELDDGRVSSTGARGQGAGTCTAVLLLDVVMGSPVL
jgi:hypothetical protein